MSTDRLHIPSASSRRQKLLEDARSGNMEVPTPAPEQKPDPTESVEDRAARVGKVHEFNCEVYDPEARARRTFPVKSHVPSPGDWLTIGRVEVNLAKIRLDALSQDMRVYVGRLARVSVLMDMDDRLWDLLQADSQLLSDLWGVSVAHETLYFRGHTGQGQENQGGGLLEVHSPVGDIRELLDQHTAHSRKTNRA